ncbi:hypothetical protein ACU4GD_23125 [Cupriavidus basilensis]
MAGRAGLIAEVNAVPGTRVDGAAPLFRIVDPTALELDLLVGRDMPAPTGGERVEVRRRGATGKVAGVVPASDRHCRPCGARGAGPTRQPAGRRKRECDRALA